MKLAGFVLYSLDASSEITDEGFIMNVNQVINMVMRQVMRRLVNKGVGMGMDRVSRMGAKDAPPAEQGARKTQNKAAGANSGQRMRQANRLIRRIGRF